MDVAILDQGPHSQRDLPCGDFSLRGLIPLVILVCTAKLFFFVFSFSWLMTV